MQKKPLFIRAEWDNEVLVWVATSDDIPGLVTEADTVENLVEKLRIMIPELLEANGLTPREPEVPFVVRHGVKSLSLTNQFHRRTLIHGQTSTNPIS